MANDTGSSQSSVRKKIREWKNTKARQRRNSIPKVEQWHPGMATPF